jgi:hypothetical protein
MTRGLLLVATLAACRSPTAPGASLAGDYALLAFDGRAVPHVVIADTVGTTTLASGTLTLHHTGIFSEVTVQVLRYAPAVAARAGVDGYTLTVTRQGTWSVRGRRLAFRLGDGTGWDGTVTARDVRYAAAGQLFHWAPRIAAIFSTEKTL